MAEGPRTHKGAGLGSEVSYGSGVDKGGRERDKKKPVSEEGIMNIHSRNGAPHGTGGGSYPLAPRSRQPSRAKLEGKGKHVASQAHGEGRGKGGEGIGGRCERYSEKLT